MKKDDLSGMIFTYWTVISEALPDKFGHIRWLCKCQCGNIKIVSAQHLKKGKSQSCGCFKLEKITKYSPIISTARDVWRQNYHELPFEDFYKISQMNCYYCGESPSNVSNKFLTKKGASQYSKDNGTFVYNGLDRINSLKFHTIDNVVPCCKWCNYAKRERSYDDFLIWIKRLYNHIIKDK